LSEYGCNTNDRKFNEVASLYSTNMTSVYSGGLVYEYSEEGSKYGLVELDGDNVKELPDFTELKNAFASTKSPTGDGGYKKDGKASQCPGESQTWNVAIAANELPAIPKGADEYFRKGAGAGPGLKGAGSQTAGSKETNLAGAGDGAVTSGAATGEKAPTNSKGAAASVRMDGVSVAPLVCSFVVVASMLLGASLI
jgi:hypothetical protein